MQKPCFGARRNNMLNLNEFQADWAAMPQVEKEKLEKLNNKTE